RSYGSESPASPACLHSFPASRLPRFVLGDILSRRLFQMSDRDSDIIGSELLECLQVLVMMSLNSPLVLLHGLRIFLEFFFAGIQEEAIDTMLHHREPSPNGIVVVRISA